MLLMYHRCSQNYTCKARRTQKRLIFPGPRWIMNKNANPHPDHRPMDVFPVIPRQMLLRLLPKHPFELDQVGFGDPEVREMHLSKRCLRK